jgi:hypothetical protein
MWDCLGNDGYALDDPEPLFRERLYKALKTYGVEVPVSPGDLILNPENIAFNYALALVQRVRLTHLNYHTEKQFEINFRGSLATQFAQATGIASTPLRADMWQAAGYSRYSEGDPVLAFQTSLHADLRKVQIYVAVEPESIPVDPIENRAGVEAAIYFLNESYRLLHDSNIETEDALEILKDLGKIVVEKLDLAILKERPKHAEPVDVYMAALNFLNCQDDDTKQTFEESLRAKILQEHRTADAPAFEREAQSILKTSWERYKDWNMLRGKTMPAYQLDYRIFESIDLGFN